MDSSAVLAVLHDESGADIVRQHLAGSVVSAVNVSEIGARLAERGVTLAAIRMSLALTGLEIASFDTELAYTASALRPATRHRGLSLGDRACLALALQRGLPALTADHAWHGLDVGVTIELIRPRGST